MMGREERVYLAFFECAPGRTVDTRTDQYDQLRRILAAVRETCRELEPRVVGDGILVAVPTADGALDLAVSLQETLSVNDSNVNSPHLLPRTVVDQGQRPRAEEDYLGQSVIALRELSGTLRAGELCISEATRRALHSPRIPMYRARRLAAGDSAAWIVDWSRRHELTPFPSALSAPAETRFVGRTAEMSRLVEAWQDSAGGARRIVFLTGEVGVGKSRLLTEFAHRVHASGSLVLAGRCDQEQVVPYQPFIEAIRELIRVSSANDLQRRLRNAASELSTLVPEIVERLPNFGSAITSVDLQRHRLFEAVASILADSDCGPAVVLCIDDLQYADSATISLLRYLATRPDTSHLFVISAYQKDDGASTPLSMELFDLRREPGVELLTLDGLGERDVMALVADWIGSRGSTAIARVLHRVTQGRPLFAEELLRHFADLGAFDRAGSWTRIFEEYDLPETMRELVSRRLAHLSPSALELLGVASVVGNTFEIQVLRSLIDLSEDTFYDSLAEACAAHIIEEQRVEPDHLSFAHGLMREVIYDDLPAFRRSAIHLAVARQLETSNRESSLIELAYHAFSAGGRADPARVIAYAHAAGDLASASLAYEEAARQYERVLKVLDAADGSNSSVRCELLLKLSEAHQRAGDMAAARDNARSALQLAKTLDAETHAQAALAVAGPYGVPGSSDDEVIRALDEGLDAFGPKDAPLKAKLMTRLGTELHPGKTWERSQSLLTAGVELATRLGDVEAILYCTNYQLHLGGPMVDRGSRADELLQLAQEHASSSNRAADAVLWAHNQRALAYLEKADVQAVRAELFAYEQSSSRLGVPFHSAFTTLWEATLALVEGRFQEAERLSQESAKLGQLAGLPDASVNHSAQHLAIKWELGIADEVLRTLETLVQALPDLPSLQCALASAYSDFDCRGNAKAVFEKLATGTTFDRLPRDATFLPSLALLSEACSYLDDRVRANVLYELLSPWPDRTAILGNAVLCYGPIARPLGLLATTRGDYAAATEHFESALEISSRMCARPSEARALRDYARMLVRRGTGSDHGHATELLAKANEIARELQMYRLQEQLTALRTLFSSFPSDRGDSLTRREREVLTHVCRGLPNKTIARQLGIAEKTISTHVSSILAKLGVADRTEAAVYAVRSGLADLAD